MNRNRAVGLALLMSGKLQERTGWAIGSSLQQVRGLQRQILGQSRIAMGNAQDVIKACSKVNCEPAKPVGRRRVDSRQYNASKES
jgi:uncharacterized protein YjbJ (UPF0337 family)